MRTSKAFSGMSFFKLNSSCNSRQSIICNLNILCWIANFISLSRHAVDQKYRRFTNCFLTPIRPSLEKSLRQNIQSHDLFVIIYTTRNNCQRSHTANRKKRSVRFAYNKTYPYPETVITDIQYLNKYY